MPEITIYQRSPYTRIYANENCVTQLQNESVVEQWLLVT